MDTRTSDQFKVNLARPFPAQESRPQIPLWYVNKLPQTAALFWIETAVTSLEHINGDVRWAVALEPEFLMQNYILLYWVSTVQEIVSHRYFCTTKLWRSNCFVLSCRCHLTIGSGKFDLQYHWICDAFYSSLIAQKDISLWVQTGGGAAVLWVWQKNAWNDTNSSD